MTDSCDAVDLKARTELRLVMSLPAKVYLFDMHKTIHIHMEGDRVSVYSMTSAQLALDSIAANFNL